MIAGFVLQSLTNLNLSQAQKNPVVSVFSAIYWLIASVAISSSLHCVLTSMLCNVYAPGLALRGPTGSMVRAVEGMIEEQTVVLRSFVLTMLSFALLLVSYSWMTMTIDAAATSSTIIIIGSYFWYSYCVRIYNKFKWKDVEISFTQDKRLKYTNKIVDQRDLLDLQAPFKEGYLSKRDISSNHIANDPWIRKYFVLQGRYLMFFNSQQEFQDTSVKEDALIKSLTKFISFCSFAPIFIRSLYQYARLI